MHTIFPLSLVLAASIVTAYESTLHLDRAKTEKFVNKKGLALALFNKFKVTPSQIFSSQMELPPASAAGMRNKILSNFHPMVRLRSDLMQGDDPYAVREDVEEGGRGGGENLGSKSFDDADGYKMFEEDKEVDDMVEEASMNLVSVDNFSLSDQNPHLA